MSRKTSDETIENLNLMFGVSDERAEELLHLMDESGSKFKIETEEGVQAHIDDIKAFGATIQETYYLFAIFGVGMGMALEGTKPVNMLIEALGLDKIKFEK